MAGHIIQKINSGIGMTPGIEITMALPKRYLVDFFCLKKGAEMILLIF
jgi:hypothetical protein